MDYGNITPGQTPGNNQVDLGKMTGNLNTVLRPGMLGNNVDNPMSAINDIAGQSKMGLMTAMANSRMQDMGLQQKLQQLQQQEKQYEMDQQKPGVTDFLGTLLSGYGAIKGKDSQNSLMNQLKSGGDWTSLYGDQAGWMG